MKNLKLSNNDRHILTVLIDALKAEINDIIAIYLFGSFGTAACRTDSDIDIAIQGQKPLDTVKLFYLSSKLAALAGREVDLIDLVNTNTVMQAQIVSSGRLIYCADTLKCDLFAASALSQYVHLNASRKELLQGIMESGSIYAR